MKIKIITCHDVYNYGASLQAYALQTYLITEGHDVEIIDYKPDYMRVHYKFWYVPRSSRYYTLTKKNVLFRFLLCCYFAPKRFATYGRKRKFDSFTRQYLHLTRRYNSYQELVSDPPASDVYIAGSDQIWNCALPNGKDPAYFLQFGGKDVRRISYAASFAIADIPAECQLMMKDWLDGFSAISVREATGLTILDTMHLKGVNVLDPVFLLSREQWSLFAKRKYQQYGKYILVYDLALGDKQLRDEAIRLSSLWDIKLLAVGGLQKCSYADVNVLNAGVDDFVGLIRDACFVISDSFHATAFSLIFHRPFSVFYKRNNGSRIVDILHYLHLEKCLNQTTSSSDIDWNMVDARLGVMVQESKNFLSANLRR